MQRRIRVNNKNKLPYTGKDTQKEKSENNRKSISFIKFIFIALSVTSVLSWVLLADGYFSITKSKVVEVPDSRHISLRSQKDEVRLSDSSGTELHVIFSTDCSEYQHWQSYLLFHSALQVKQPGHVTRIASGCSDEEAETARAWHEEHISSAMSDRFHLHLTPHFSKIERDGRTLDYKFFNKPFGLKHWMENGIGMGIDESTGVPLNEDVVVILIDPDNYLLRPILSDFNTTETITKEKDFEKFPLKVSHGHPVAQKYGLGAQWTTFQLKTITDSTDSPALSVSRRDANAYYPAGPPYLATARDMYQIALKWAEFVPKVHAEYPYLLAEMYAYCIAAAHLKLPHLMIESLMISNSDAGGEGWDLVDAIPGNVCDYDHLSAKRPPSPNIAHFCQRYIVGEYFFAKRKMPKDFFNCGKPLMVVPPIDLGESFQFKYPLGRERNSKGMIKTELKPKVARRDAFMICVLTNGLNAAGKFYKAHHCVDEEERYDLNLATLP